MKQKNMKEINKRESHKCSKTHAIYIPPNIDRNPVIKIIYVY